MSSDALKGPLTRDQKREGKVVKHILLVLAGWPWAIMSERKRKGEMNSGARPSRIMFEGRDVGRTTDGASGGGKSKKSEGSKVFGGGNKKEKAAEPWGRWKK